MTDLADVSRETSDDEFPQSVIKNEPGRNGVPRATECITCGTPLPEKGEEGYHPQRKYCVSCGAPSDAKKGKKTKSSTRTRTKVGPAGDEPAPRSVTNNFTIKASTGKTKLSNEIAAVEEGATYMLGFAPMIMAALGDTVCPEALSQAIPDIARQLAVLSKYHPFIRKIFVSGEGSGEFMAWIGLLITISPVIVTVLAHHELISGKVGERIAYASAFGGMFADVVKETGPDDGQPGE
jgi:ribosomal protein L37E